MGTTCEGMTHEPQLVPSSGWRSVGSGAQSPQFEPPSTELPPSPCSAFGSGSFLPAPAPTLAHFHTASHVAWLLTKLNFNYFFFFFLNHREQQRSAGSSCLSSCSRDRSVGAVWWGRGTGKGEPGVGMDKQKGTGAGSWLSPSPGDVGCLLLVFIPALLLSAQLWEMPPVTRAIIPVSAAPAGNTWGPFSAGDISRAQADR